MDLPFWMRTVGAPRAGDPRDGELHQGLSLEEHWDLESWDEEIDDDARYWRNPAEPPEVDSEGREIWLYHYVPYGESPPWLR